MKKKIKLLSIFVFLILFTGCTKEKEVVKTCTLTSDQSSYGYKLTSTYEIHAKNNYVENVITKETITTDEESIISYFVDYLNKTYKKANKTYGGYTYSVDKTDNSVTANVTIDYNKLNLKKFIKSNSSIKNYIGKNNKIKLDGVIKIYEKLGAKCED
jgi:epoxyqueuosine reductase QueG